MWFTHFPNHTANFCSKIKVVETTQCRVLGACSDIWSNFISFLPSTLFLYWQHHPISSKSEKTIWNSNNVLRKWLQTGQPLTNVKEVINPARNEKMYSCKCITFVDICYFSKNLNKKLILMMLMVRIILPLNNKALVCASLDTTLPHFIFTALHTRYCHIRKCCLESLRWCLAG